MAIPLGVLFDIDETLVHTGGAGARSWAWAFDQLYRVAADIGAHTSAGETNPQVGQQTFREVLSREPGHDEIARLYAKYLRHLSEDIWSSAAYRVRDDADKLLTRLADALATKLQNDGERAFDTSWDSLLAAMERTISRLGGTQRPAHNRSASLRWRPAASSCPPGRRCETGQDPGHPHHRRADRRHSTHPGPRQLDQQANPPLPTPPPAARSDRGYPQGSDYPAVAVAGQQL